MTCTSLNNVQSTCKLFLHASYSCVRVFGHRVQFQGGTRKVAVQGGAGANTGQRRVGLVRLVVCAVQVRGVQEWCAAAGQGRVGTVRQQGRAAPTAGEEQRGCSGCG